MRQFPSNGGGVLDASELDPCLAAESRMKQSFVSSKMKKLIIILGVLCLLLLLVGLLFFFLGKSDDTIDYEEHQAQPNALIDVGPGQKEIFVKQTEAPYYVTDAPTPTPRIQHETIVASYDVHYTENRPVLRVVDTLTTTPASTTSTSSTPAPTTQSSTTTRSTSTTTPRPTPAREPTVTFPQPTVSIRVSYMQVEPSVIPLTEEHAPDCLHHRDAGFGSGIYVINPDGGEPFHVFCDMETDGGGWTVIQRRLDGDVPFYNYTYREYQEGFGQLRSSHWLGLEYMHRLAPSGYDPLTLRIELRGDTCPQCSKQPDGFWWGEWDFALGPAKTYYTLEISETQLRGNMSNPVGGKGRWEQDSNGRPFTTMDVDNDENGAVNCAQFRSHGGWWHRDCTRLALNGRYGDDKSKMRYLVYLYEPPRLHPRSIVANYYIHPRQTLMMLRPRI